MSREDVCTLTMGTSPLLVSVPHGGRQIPEDIAAGMTPAALAVPDTDWHVGRLYDFCTTLGASLLVANYSRYVVDLNRPPNDEALYPGQLATGLCPVATFAGDPLYENGCGISDAERDRRIDVYWRPYHDRLRAELCRLRADHGVALLWDAHSIASQVPALFDGELPALNLGSDGGTSSAPAAEASVTRVAESSGYSFVANGRFRGGYITRYYGRPAAGFHALQMEIAQRTYMNEAALRYDPDLADRLRVTLIGMLQAFIDSADRISGEGGQT